MRETNVWVSPVEFSELLDATEDLLRYDFGDMDETSPLALALTRAWKAVRAFRPAETVSSETPSA